jgi:germination protein M
MTPARGLVLGGHVLAAVAIAGILFVGLPRWKGGRTAPRAVAAAPAPTAPAPPGRKIKARLFYLSDDGTRLAAVEREVPFGEGTVEQAREIISAQIAPVDEPLASAVPRGTKLLALFVTEQGQAFVDLSHEVSTGHGGGTLDEVLTVYTIVDTLTANLPAVTSVQVLVDGKQVDTLAGHVDLRHPLAQNLAWVE